MFIRDSQQKHYEPAATLYQILLLKSSASKDRIKKPCHKISLLMHPEAGGDEKSFKNINWAYQILTNDAARETHNTIGLDDAEKVMSN